MAPGQALNGIVSRVDRRHRRPDRARAARRRARAGRHHHRASPPRSPRSTARSRSCTWRPVSAPATSTRPSRKRPTASSSASSPRCTWRRRRAARQPARTRPSSRRRSSSPATPSSTRCSRRLVGDRALRWTGSRVARDSGRLVLVTAHRREILGRADARRSVWPSAGSRSPPDHTRPADPPQPRRARGGAPLPGGAATTSSSPSRSATPSSRGHGGPTSCSPTPAACRRRRRASASPCSSCATTPSAPRRSTPAPCASSAPIAHASCSRSHQLLTDEAAYKAMANAVNPYGDGRAAAARSPRSRSCSACPSACPTSSPRRAARGGAIGPLRPFQFRPRRGRPHRFGRTTAKRSWPGRPEEHVPRR